MTTDNIPLLILNLNNYSIRLRRFYARHAADLQEIRDFLKSDQSGSHCDDRLGARFGGPENLCDTAHVIYRSIADTIIRFAESHLSRCSVRISISDSEIPPALLPTDDSWASFSVLALWSHLAAAYGGDKATHRAYREAADRLIKAFRFDDRPDIVEHKSSIAIGLTMYSESSYSGGKNYSHHNRDSFGYAFLGIRTFIEYLHKQGLGYIDPETFSAIEQEASEWASWSGGFIPGKSHVVSPHLTIVPRLRSVDFKLSHAVAAALREFIGLYRTPPMAAEAG